MAFETFQNNRWILLRLDSDSLRFNNDGLEVFNDISENFESI